MAAFLPIDYQKSIAKQKLIYKGTSSLFFIYASSAFGAFVPIALITMPAVVNLSATLTSFRPYY